MWIHAFDKLFCCFDSFLHDFGCAHFYGNVRMYMTRNVRIYMTRNVRIHMTRNVRIYVTRKVCIDMTTNVWM